MSNLPAVNTSKILDLKRLLEAKKGSIASVLPAHLTPERMIKLALVAASRNPQLLTCSPESILKALMDSSQLGLEPFTGLNQAYILPYRNKKTGTVEAQFMPSYRGLIDLARRSGQIQSIEARIIHSKDKYEIEMGLNPKLIHIPKLDGKDRGEPILVYAICKLKDNAVQYEVMTMSEVERIRSFSRASNSGPWVDHYETMVVKTCLKKLLKLCPMSVDLAKAVAIDNAIESGEEIFDVDAIDPAAIAETASATAATPSKSDQLADKI